MSYNLFESYEGIHQPKTTLNNKLFAPIIPQRVTIDYFPFNLVMETSLLLDFIFAIDFNVPISFDFYTWQGIQITYPDFPQYLQKINIPPTSIPSTIILQPNVSSTYSQTQITKCQFGVSTFDFCYYDPNFTIENAKQYLRSAINKISRNLSTQLVFQGLDVNPYFGEYANRLLNSIMQLIQKSTIMNVMILDFSEFPEHYEENPLFVIFPFQYVSQIMEINNLWAYPQYFVLDQVLWGAILDWNPLDAEFFIDYPVSIMTPQFQELVGRIGEAVLNMYNPINTATHLAFVDPTIPSLPIPPSLTELFQEAFPGIAENAPFAPLTNRAEKWGMSMQFMREIQRIVKNIVGPYVMNGFQLNMYMKAGVEYCMAFHHNHDRVRFRTLENIGLDAFNNFWISKWSAWGLDNNLLNNLANILSEICPQKIVGFKGVASPISQ